jgi:hypothetical protein
MWYVIVSPLESFLSFRERLLKEVRDYSSHDSGDIPERVPPKPMKLGV